VCNRRYWTKFLDFRKIALNTKLHLDYGTRCFYAHFNPKATFDTTPYLVVQFMPILYCLS